MDSPPPDPAFQALSDRLQHRIDRAFTKATSGASSVKSPAPGGVLLNSGPSSAPGGFIIDEPSAGGGFVLDEDTAGGVLQPSATADVQYIPVSRIPFALQLLDLPPDDEDVLSVFRNAAEGWGSSRSRARSGEGEVQEEEEGGRVSKNDWRAVCAALLDEPAADEDLEPEPESGDEDEDVVPIEIDESEGGTSDEYTETTRPKRARASKPATKAKATSSTSRTKRRRRSPSSSPSESGELTARQKATCIDAFLLFFPGLSKDAALKRRIGVRELVNAAGLLKEKIKAEEMVEMLESFSSSPDKTMNLPDFERMMVATRMA